MIIQIKGNVKYPITLDPSVWIFDDRKVKLEEGFQDIPPSNHKEIETSIKLNKPSVNNSIKKYNKKELLENSYLMPIKEFIENAEMSENVLEVMLFTQDGSVTITKDQLLNSFLLFSIDGKQIKDQGPAYLYFGDGSNKDNPIKGVKEIKMI
ncbi:hypothetical protein JCM21714_744 [Gracilibacillus boraciitolerans JCM 21714]|uniref:Peptidyl-prolyl cis-trans isomerase n=1 Tax=Gracilibacillus boraciitolerans JCM 21714 TaxID=1298598 RepID=W4VF00_9BACI|nr:hypothetical protein [Gracilibacillus boraciitolerans]GAE91787.1 hypothetical protein JCM21714_744 [Gracilibacillus boraciitolerans JCM 21714]